ncbi:MAG: hypothetical protein QOG53_1963 [Frankiales bacterium]|jgi:hypothetical protein|nr:hypothetical protein [Frankiales bacterium]
MAELSFECLDVTAEQYTAAPTLTFRLRITEATGVPVHTLALHTQIRIEPVRRRYDPLEVDRLNDLFGTPDRWGDTLHAMQFATVSTMIQGFVDSTEVDIPVQCTFDTEVAASKYFTSLADGEIPFLLLFSGTAFIRGGTGVVVDPVPWDREVNFRMPVATWRELMDYHFGGSAWLRMGRHSIDALSRFRTSRALKSWDDTVAHLLKEAGEELP